MIPQTYPLTCPSCSGAVTLPTTDISFGCEVACNACGTRSLLIIDNHLITRASVEAVGGRICTGCGRVARGEARFCQCGAKLVRTCYWCCKEVPIDHRRCDICGWLDPGHGIVSEIESGWVTFLALLPHKDMSDQFDCYVRLFRFIWFDCAEKATYHQRYRQILDLWSFGRRYDNCHLNLFCALQDTIGQPIRDFFVSMATKDDKQAVSAVELFTRLAEGDFYTGACKSCQQVARDALMTIAAWRAATRSAREQAVDALRGQRAFAELVTLAAGQDADAASLAIGAIEKMQMRRAYRPQLEDLRRCTNREVAARAKDLVKRTDWYRVE